jgi:AcrR family transcriptional regulator
VTETRAEQKERTRRAILDAALELTAETGLATLSLRSVAREVGVVPTAFYRHFDSIDALGLALVEEAFVSLRAMLSAVRQPEAIESLVGIVDSSVRVVVEHVRAAIRHELELCEHELATDLARLPQGQALSTPDLRTLSGLIVTLMVGAAEDLLAAQPSREAAVVKVIRTRLRMVLIGAVNWRSGAVPAV